MKTQDIAFGGILAAMFIVLGFVFGSDVRVVQTCLEIPKTAVVAISTRLFIERRKRVMFIVACFLLSLIILPLQITIIYNIPCLIGGYIIGIQSANWKSVKNFALYFLCNIGTVFYEFYLYTILTGQNLFGIYCGMFGKMMMKIGISATKIIHLIFVGWLLVDSLLSAVIIYIISIILIKRVENLFKIA